MIHTEQATDSAAWDDFLARQRFSPFLQSWTMGEVYRDIGQEPVRITLKRDGKIRGICFGHVVPARRGRHLAVPYGPVLEDPADMPAIVAALTDAALKNRCGFVRMSPFMENTALPLAAHPRSLPAPLHLLAEHVWYLPLKDPDPWSRNAAQGPSTKEEELLMKMRKTTRNLIRRAEKEGVAIERSTDPERDVEQFIALHDETRKRHGFTPYGNTFFRAQVRRFAPRKEAILYLARYQGETIAASIHMRFGGETSYHHGASTQRFSKIPASYLLQWTAIRDALAAGDGIYSFWGIAPMSYEREATSNEQNNNNPSAQSSKLRVQSSRHPFAGVTLFKTGFSGKLLELPHCTDIPLSRSYRLTRWFEYARKWRRGF